ncbi:MAG: hypothetical protein LV480_03705 [Methylacidiphilales bacterium]|nr:hypothetical protein [Candidatus Methylacidiphilales bacterium]
MKLFSERLMTRRVKLGLALFLLAPALASADMKVLVTETFDETNSTTIHNGHTVAWSSEVMGGIQVVNDPGLASGKAFKGRKIVGILPFMALSNPGDAVRVHFTFRLAGPISSTQGGFKVGLFENGDPNNPWYVSAGNGYRWNIATGPYPAAVTLAKESGGSGQKVLSGQDTTFIDQSNAAFALNDTAKHTATINLREGDDGLHLSLAIDGKTIMRSSDLLVSSLAPTCFAIRSDANVFFFDDFSVAGNMKSGAMPY